MKVYFVRHGESEGNKKGLHQAPETSLSEKGKKQAEILAERLIKLPIDFIYSSTQARAKETAEIIGKTLKKPIELWEDLKEIRLPSEVWNRPIDEPDVVEIRRLIGNNWLKGNWRYSNEETLDELILRAGKVVKRLLSHHKDQNVLCVSHASIIKAIVTKMMYGDGLTPQIFLGFRLHAWINNTGITVCERFEKYGWVLVNWNDSSHL